MARRKKGRQEGGPAEGPEPERSSQTPSSGAGQEVQGWRDVGRAFASRVVWRGSRFAVELAQRIGIISRQPQLRGLPVWRPQYPAAGGAGWADRLLAPVRNMVGHVQGKFERTPLVARQPADLLWFNRARTGRAGPAEVRLHSSVEGLPLDTEVSGHSPWRVPGEDAFDKVGPLPDRDTGVETIPSFTVSKQEHHLSGEAASPGAARAEKMVQEVSRRLGVAGTGPPERSVAGARAVVDGLPSSGEGRAGGPGSEHPAVQESPDLARRPITDRQERRLSGGASLGTAGTERMVHGISRRVGLPGGDVARPRPAVDVSLPSSGGPVPGPRSEDLAGQESSRPADTGAGVVGPGGAPSVGQTVPRSAPTSVARKPSTGTPGRGATGDDTTVARVAETLERPSERAYGVAQRSPVQATPMRVPDVASLAREVAGRWQPEPETGTRPGETYPALKPVDGIDQRGFPAVFRLSESGRVASGPRSETERRVGVALPGGPAAMPGRQPTVDEAGRRVLARTLAEVDTQTDAAGRHGGTGLSVGPAEARSLEAKTGTVGQGEVEGRRLPIAQLVQQRTTGFLKRLWETPATPISQWQAGGQEDRVARPVETQVARLAQRETPSRRGAIGEATSAGVTARPAAGSGWGGILGGEVSSLPHSEAWPSLVHGPITAQPGSSRVWRSTMEGESPGEGPLSFVEGILYRTGAARAEPELSPAVPSGQGPGGMAPPGASIGPGTPPGRVQMSRFGWHERPAAAESRHGAVGPRGEGGARPLAHLMPPIAAAQGFDERGGWNFVQAKRDYPQAPSRASWGDGGARGETPKLSTMDFAGRSVVQTAHAEWRASEERLPLAAVGGGIRRNGSGQADIAREPLYRAEVGEVTMPERTVGKEAEAKKPDLDELARKLYPRIKQMLAIERERRGFC